jgi:hypothetical protein
MKKNICHELLHIGIGIHSVVENPFVEECALRRK